MLRVPTDPIEPAASVMLALLRDDRDAFWPLIANPAAVAGGLVRITVALGLRMYGTPERFAEELDVLMTTPIEPRPIDNEENR